MNTGMIEELLKEMKPLIKEYSADVEVDHDFAITPASEVIELMRMALEDTEIGDWIGTGDCFVMKSKIGDSRVLTVVLLKRGVEIDFVEGTGVFPFPQSFDKTANEEVKK